MVVITDKDAIRSWVLMALDAAGLTAYSVDAPEKPGFYITCGKITPSDDSEGLLVRVQGIKETNKATDEASRYYKALKAMDIYVLCIYHGPEGVATYVPLTQSMFRRSKY